MKALGGFGSVGGGGRAPNTPQQRHGLAFRGAALPAPPQTPGGVGNLSPEPSPPPRAPVSC